MCVSQQQVRRTPMMDIFREQRDLGFRYTQSFLCRSRFRGCDDLRVLLAGELSKIGKGMGPKGGEGGKREEEGEKMEMYVSRGFD